MLQTVMIVVSLAFTAVAVALVVRAVRMMLGVIRRGQPAPGRTSNPAGRTLTMLKETVLHTRMLQWSWVGILHWFAFAAFIVLSTAVGSAFFQLFDPTWTIPWLGKFFLYEWVCEFLGLLGSIAIIPLIIYRLTHLPERLGRKSRFFGSTMWQAYFVEAMVLLESIAILFIRGAEKNLRLAHGGDEAHGATGFHFPISQLFSHLYPTGHENIGALENIIFVIATIKVVSAMIWLIVISTNLTMGVAWHRFLAWFNIWLKREQDGTTALGAAKPLTSGGKAITLDDIDDLDEDSVLGVGSIWDFSWKDILDFTTCTECGRCQSQCPAWNTEKPLSPKLMMMGLREHAYAAAGGVEGAEDKALVGKAGEGEWFYNPEGGDFVIDEDALWSCTNCGACVQQCPVDIEHVDHFIDMRRYQVLVESNFPSELNGLFKGLENKGNPWNMSPNARLDWAKDLPFEVKVVGDDIESLESVDWLFWVGCAGAYEDRAKKTTRAVAELLDIAGVSFGVLGNGETCTGDSARRAGNEFVFQGLAQQNVETFKEYKVKKVVSTCAHCFNTLKNEYKDFGIELEVVHHTQLLNRLVREGKLTPVKDGDGAHKRSITYHDPCFLGRHNQVYSPPRDLLQILPGAEYKEMDRSAERSFCCGAGGARMWMEEKLGERINLDRTNEAVGTGADQIAVGCPFCRVMLSDGLTKMQADGEAREEVEVLDVAQMLLASVKGEQATKLRPGEGAAAGATAKKKSVETKAEPEEGDVTVTEDTVVATEDAGPAAKASGGSSLFDDAPAEKAEPAEKPSAESEGGSLFDTPAEDKPEKAEKAETTSGGGSLFDVAPTEDEPAEKPADKPADKPAAEEPAAKPAADLGSGGSLFDVAPTEDEPAEKPAAEEPADKPAEEQAVEAETEGGASATPEESAPASSGGGAASEPHSDVDLSSGGSLFDIEAPQQTEAPASAPADSAEAAPVQAEERAEESEAVQSAPDPTAVSQAFTGDAEESESPSESPSEEAPAASAPAEPEAAEQAAPEEEPAAEQDAAAEEPTEAEPEPEEKTAPASSGEKHEPRTDADIHNTGSLFDL
ncbi:MAG: heterodisulfide reductase-related iron-sulfur binding cluster [Nocardioidaceae bacterium]|nr:heterodisulfide reductase-related iron-sulfur binding cluster [Nocardioidaceae bacterium]MCL2612954.1 heterodisulfide reductase-related iron-sulfur binding cluster [Nocardioidaceae bacterium]